MGGTLKPRKPGFLIFYGIFRGREVFQWIPDEILTILVVSNHKFMDSDSNFMISVKNQLFFGPGTRPIGPGSRDRDRDPGTGTLAHRAGP